MSAVLFLVNCKISMSEYFAIERRIFVRIEAFMSFVYASNTFGLVWLGLVWLSNCRLPFLAERGVKINKSHRFEWTNNTETQLISWRDNNNQTDLWVQLLNHLLRCMVAQVNVSYAFCGYSIQFVQSISVDFAVVTRNSFKLNGPTTVETTLHWHYIHDNDEDDGTHLNFMSTELHAL